MRIYEIAGTKFDPLLMEFWRTRSPEDLAHYCVQDHCTDASRELIEFLESKGIGYAEMVPAGTIVGNKKKQGWIQVDTPVFNADALTDAELAEMRKLKLNPANPKDIQQYAEQKGTLEELTWIPHSWVEVRGTILDPSGFYPDGQSGQFDRLVNNKSNLAQRYRYF